MSAKTERNCGRLLISKGYGWMANGLMAKSQEEVQFNLPLSEKEQIDKAKVVLSFEHQGNGEPIQIYDGWRSLKDSKNEAASVATGILQTDEITYLHDSDDERPDSKEDQDDDLDIILFVKS